MMMPNGIVLPIFSSAGHGGGQAYNAIGGTKKMKHAFGAGGKKGRKGWMPHQPPMMVNLVVDPSTLSGGGGSNNASKPPSRYDDSGFDEEDGEAAFKVPQVPNNRNAGFKAAEMDEEEEDHDFAIPNSAAAEASRKRASSSNQNQPLARMMDTMQFMKLQDKWREARRRTRRLACIDALWAVIWAAESMFALGFGGSCKPGTGHGW